MAERTPEQVQEWKELQSAYRKVFSDPLGREVLTDILNDLHFFSHRLEDDEQRTLHNAAQTILAKLGVMDERVDQTVEALLTKELT